MRLGTSIFLLALGGILTFAVTFTVSGIDLQTVGVILMIVGALGIVLEFALFRPRLRRTVATTRRDGAPGTSTTTTSESTRDV